MKKRTILTAAIAVLLVAVLVVGGSLAYFTDKDSATNTFTVGNVKIELIESQLHRVNAGVANGNTSKSLLWTPEVRMNGESGTAVEHGTDSATAWAGEYFTDDQIKTDAGTYKAGYFKANATNMVPGSNVRKCPYVINNGTTDAYVRVRVLVPVDLFAIIDNGPSYWTTTALEHGVTSAAVEYYNSNGYSMENYSQVERDNVAYYEFDFTYPEALAPDEMTFWNCWGNIAIAKNTTSAQLETVTSFNVIIEADAIQADGFADATAAFAAYQAQK